MSRFADIANKKIEETERPPLPPTGSYLCEVVNEPSPVERTSPNGSWEVIDFSLKGLQAMDDVDPEELEKFGGPANVLVRHGFMFDTEDEVKFLQTENRMKDFLRKHLGVSDDEAPDYSSALALVKGRQCIAEVGLRQDKNDAETFYSEVKKTMAAE